jgi:tRNA dimethylallyltransferase
MLPLLVAIVGPTATGKTAVAVALAQRIDGEIINADSRQLYRGMDLGTAKPTAAEQAAARHWLIDLADPDERFTLARVLDLSREAMRDIAARGRVPIVAGGTGQYVWALLEGWRVPRVAPDAALRAELEAVAARGAEGALSRVLEAEDPASARRIDPRNLRRVIRAIEVSRATGRPFSAWQEKDGPPAERVVLLGLRFEREELYRRIDARVDTMMDAGLVDEVRGLRDRYGRDAAAMSGIGYRQLCQYLEGELSLHDAVERIKTETHRLARMQHTWFRADDPRITWLDAGDPGLLDHAARAVQAA